MSDIVNKNIPSKHSTIPNPDNKQLRHSKSWPGGKLDIIESEKDSQIMIADLLKASVVPSNNELTTPEKYIIEDIVKPCSGRFTPLSNDNETSSVETLKYDRKSNADFLKSCSKAKIAALRGNTKSEDSPFWNDRTIAVPNKDYPLSREFPDIPGVISETYDPIMIGMNEIWKNVKKNPSTIPGLTTKVRKTFHISEDPFGAVLYMISKCDDFYKIDSGTLPMFIMNEFKKWLAARELKITQLSGFTSELKHIAFTLLTMQKNSELNKIVCEVYQFGVISTELVSSIKDLCTWGMYREACQFATLLKLQSEFDIHSFVIPLLFQDHENLIHPYVMGNNVLQTTLLEYLKTFLEVEFTDKALKLYVRSQKIRLVKMEKLNEKQLIKLVKRLEDLYKMNDNKVSTNKNKINMTKKKSVTWKIQPITPNVLAKQNKARPQPRDADFTLEQVKRALRYVEIHQNDPKPSTSQNAMKKDVILDTPKLSIFKEAAVDKHNKITYGLECSKKSSDYPIVVNVKDENYISFQNENPKFYSVQFPHDINYFQTPSGAQMFFKALKAAHLAQRKKGGNGSDLLVVCFNIKWIPVLTACRASLIIFLLADEVFILDIIRLETFKGEREKLWSQLFQEFFNNPEILKVGFGAGRIVQALCGTGATQVKVKDNFTMFLDLCSTGRTLMENVDGFFPYVLGNSIFGYGLAELVRICTGKPLDKSKNLSNWKIRPLRNFQIYHTATEVYALMNIFGYIRKRSWELKYDFETLVLEIMNHYPNTYKINNQKKTSYTPQQLNRTNKLILPGNPFRIGQTAGEIKFVCDNMFQELGKELRACGIDTLILRPNQFHSECARYASRDGRFIITTREYSKSITHNISPGFCCEINMKGISDQLDHIFKYFNLQVRETDIFTRCQECNGCVFIVLDTDTMKNLMNMDKRLPSFSTLENEHKLTYISLKLISEHVRSGKKWKLIPVESIIKTPENIRTSAGAPIYFEEITKAHFEAYGLMFIICNLCGKIYCEGCPHFLPLKNDKS